MKRGSSLYIQWVLKKSVIIPQIEFHSNVFIVIVVNNNKNNNNILYLDTLSREETLFKGVYIGVTVCACIRFACVIRSG